MNGEAKKDDVTTRRNSSAVPNCTPLGEEKGAESLGALCSLVVIVTPSPSELISLSLLWRASPTRAEESENSEGEESAESVAWSPSPSRSASSWSTWREEE